MIRRSVVGADGASLSVCDWREGTAPATPFLLVHGLASNARLWDGVARRLTAAGHPVVAVDQRGHGRSAKPDVGYDTDTVCADLIAVLDDLGWQRSIAVGQSWGGNVVVELAARHPERLAGICGIDGGTLRLADRFSSWEECRAALAPPPLMGTPAEVVRQRMEAMHPDWPPEGIDGAMACFEVRADGTIAPWLSLEHHLAILASLYADDPARLWGSITVPTLFVGAADATQVAWTARKREETATAVGALAHGRAVWFEGADHDVHAQHPAEVTQVLLDQVSDGFWR